MNRRGPENAIPLVLLAGLLIPAVWTAQGVVWRGPWSLTFGLYCLGTALGVFAIWLMVGWSVWRPSLLEILVGVLMLAAGVLVVEITGRLVFGWTADPPLAAVAAPAKGEGGFVPDQRLGWRMRAGESVAGDDGPGPPLRYMASRAGFRTVTSTAPRRAHRVAFVGDGLTFGAGVPSEATFAARAAAMLDRRPVLRALPGLSSAAILNLFDEVVASDRLAAVVVAFVDPSWRRHQPIPAPLRVWPRPRFIVDDGIVRLRTAKDRLAPSFRWLRTHSALWASLYSLDRYVGRFTAWGDDAVIDDHVFTLVVERAQARRRRVLFVRLPSPTPTDSPHTQDVFHRLGAPYLDLGRPTAHAPRSIHYPGTVLLNPQGHEWVARKVRKRLVRLLAQ